MTDINTNNPGQPERFSRHEAKKFADKWVAITNEKSSAQSYWRDFFTHVVQVRDLQDAGIEFEYRVRSHLNGAMRWIDVFWPGIALIEHKSAGKNLDDAETQAREYLASLKAELRPPVIILSDFARWRIIDVLVGTSIEFGIADLPQHMERIESIFSGEAVKVAEVQVIADKQASRLMTDLYKELARNHYESHAANILLSRLLFLMFGDDTQMFPPRGQGLFHSYILDSREDGQDLGGKLATLFQILNKAKENRPGNISDHLAMFPYVGSDLFAENIEVPVFDKPMREALLKATEYDWSTISPAIFGSLFQSVKSKEDRHAGGEHYTSEKNIMKLIRPLFLDDYTDRMWAAWDNHKALDSLRRELGSKNYLDPACGCGNILVVAYRELRELEIQMIARIKQLDGTYGQVGLFTPSEDVHVSLKQFHGIEIEEWPAQIARVALYLTEHQMNVELDTITGITPNRFPMTSGATIYHGNALQVEWTDVCPIDDNTIIMGNPPFLGSSNQGPEQKADQKRIWTDSKGKAISGGGAIDFVANWYLLAARYMAGTKAAAAFVSTNSITQGEQPATLWGQINPFGMGIDFAHRTFAWENGAGGQAAVHCVIIGFSARPKSTTRPLWDYPDAKGEPNKIDSRRINAYLVDAPETLITSRRTPLSAAAQVMDYGSKPTDAGHLSNISKEEANGIRGLDSIASTYLRRILGADELINNRERWCLWLVNVEPAHIRQSPELQRRMESVRAMRTLSTKEVTRLDADRPGEFQEIRQPNMRYLAVPRVVSEKREYLTTSLFDADVIATDALFAIRNADTSTFALMSSRVFMVWNSTVSGRLKSDYRISAEITYNNFPWPELTEVNRPVIESAAQAVLDARAAHPGSSLADLYDPLAMPSDLRAAHKVLDKAVLAAYGLSASASDAEILEHLFNRYAALVASEQANS